MNYLEKVLGFQMEEAGAEQYYPSVVAAQLAVVLSQASSPRLKAASFLPGSLEVAFVLVGPVKASHRLASAENSYIHRDETRNKSYILPVLCILRDRLVGALFGHPDLLCRDLPVRQAESYRRRRARPDYRAQTDPFFQNIRAFFRRFLGEA